MDFTSGIGRMQEAMNALAPAGANKSTGVDSAQEAIRKDTAALVATPGSLGLSGGSEMKLSSTAGALMHSLAGPDERMGKVQALQASITAGTYNVSASAVADKLMHSMMG